MNSCPAISWLVCSNVSNQNLHRAINSCFEQSFTDFELILVANGPQSADVADGVARAFGRDERLRVIQTDVRHLIFSLNLGLHYAKADLIARMDADDLAYPERLSKQFQFMKEHPEVAVLGTAYDRIDLDDHVIDHVEQPLRDRDIRRALLLGNPFCHPSVVFRRQIIIEVGGYLGSLHAEDYDLWSRLALNRSLKFANLKDPLIGYRAIPSGGARRARLAYAAVAGTQWRNFVAGGGLTWAGAALLSTLKASVLSRPAD